MLISSIILKQNYMFKYIYLTNLLKIKFYFWDN